MSNPTVHPPRRTGSWQSRAACGSEPAELWTSGTGRHMAEVDAHLRQICLGCPVLTQCARYTVENRLEAEYRAGIRVPAKNASKRWLTVMATLADLAGVPAPASLTDKSTVPTVPDTDLDSEILAARRSAQFGDDAPGEDFDALEDVDAPEDWDLDLHWGRAS
ncbi:MULTISPECIES: WhiB family transcriptional regulator [Mycobacteroides]|uniref:WhiB family transcriptional regulator n=1 Tax=Mycobacteroides TaxID=670516 RepID=UPI0009C0E4AC|nr:MULTISPECIES: WhiB family transcriptional regulator [Mycobacteroides]